MSVYKASTQTDDTADLALLHQYRQSGDLAVLGKLYRPYMGLVYGVCLKYLKDEERCKDAVMQIFEELVEKAARHEVKQFRSWLYVLTRNHCLMQLRSAKKTEIINLDDVMENSLVLHPEEKDNEHQLNALQHCLEKLPATQKQSVTLFYYQEKCYKEIVKETGFSLNEVKSYIQNGKRNLKICLDKNREQ